MSTPCFTQDELSLTPLQKDPSDFGNLVFRFFVLFLLGGRGGQGIGWDGLGCAGGRGLQNEKRHSHDGGAGGRDPTSKTK